MQNTKLIQLLKTFSAKEMKEFCEFVRSPFYNKNRALVNFTDHLKNAHPAFESKNVDKVKIFGTLFPGKKYKDSVMRLLSSDLLKHIKNYLTLLFLKKNPLAGKMHLIEELNSRRVNNIVRILLKEYSEELEKTPLFEMDYQAHRLHFLDQLYMHYDQEFKGNQHRVFEKYDIQQSINALNYSYVCRLLNYFLFLDSLKQYYGIDFDLSFFMRVFKALDPEIQASPSVRLSFLLMKLAQTGDPAYFHRAKEFVFDPVLLDAVRQRDRWNLFASLTNFCIKNITEGRHEYESEKFKLQKKQVELHLLFSAWALKTDAPLLFINAVNTACVLGELDWANKFISDNAKYLEADVRDSVVNQCEAYICLAEKKYSEALTRLNRIDFVSPRIKAIHKNLLSRIYYEKRESGALRFLLDSYKHFLANDSELPASYKALHIDFIRILRKLENARAAKTTAKAQALRNEILQNKKLLNYLWLIEKAKEIAG